LGTAENKSGYVFGIHVNFDAGIDGAKVELDAMEIGDSDIPAPFRKYARIWLAQDYQNSLARSNRKRRDKMRLTKKSDGN
jgi:hypothetical protein